jgi:hypothetical protein
MGDIARDYKSHIMRVNWRPNAEVYQQMVLESGVIQHMNTRYGRNASDMNQHEINHFRNNQ